MKNKSLLVLSLALLLPSAFSVASCSGSEGGESQESASSVSSLIEIENPFEKVYGVGTIIDFSTITFGIKVDGQALQVRGDDSRLNIVGGSTDTVGKFTIVVTFQGASVSFEYEVVQYYLTLNFGDGSLDGKSSVKLPFYNNRVDITDYIPSAPDAEDGSTQDFAGWFYDEECTQRALFAHETEFSGFGDFTLHASYEINRDSLFEYSIDSAKNTATITSLNFDSLDIFFMEELTIPSTIKGYPVTEIGPYLLRGTYVDFDTGETVETDWASMLSVSEINFEENSRVEKIGKYAFSNLSYLTKATFPDSLISIEESAFSATSLSGKLTLNKKLQKIGADAFSYNSNLLEVEFEEGSQIKIIGEGAFQADGLLCSVQFPEGLEEIRDEAFADCTDLTTLDLPSTLSIIGSGAFKRMTSLERINVNASNPNYSSLDGNLYSKDMKTLIRYCYKSGESSFSLPSEVISIGDSAFAVFSDFVSLKTLDLGNNLLRIGKEAFSSCTYPLNLPESLNSFSVEAFAGYAGTSINVDSANEKYTSLDGILYSKDYATLYACPQAYEKVDFALDDRVETINRKAFLNCSAISSFSIGKNSALKEIQKDGLVLASMTSLRYLYIEKSEGINYNVGSLVSMTAYGNFSVIVVLPSKEDKEKFLSSSEENATLADKTYSKDEVAEKTLGLIENVFEVSFASFEEGSNGLVTLIDPLADNVQNSFALLGYGLKNNLFSDDERSYVSDYVKSVYFSLYSEVFLKENFSVSNNTFSAGRLLRFYLTLPSDLQSSVKTYLDAIVAKYPFLDKKDDLNNLYEDIVSFEADGETFDSEAFALIKARADALSFDQAINPTKVYEKYNLLYVDDKIKQLLAVDLDSCTPEQLDEVYAVLKPCNENGWSGLLNRISGNFNGPYRQSRIYHYEEFVAFVDKFEEIWSGLGEKLLTKIKAFDFSAFDFDSYLSFYNNNVYLLWNRFGYLVDSEASQVNALMAASIEIYSLTNKFATLNDDNFADAYALVDYVDSLLVGEEESSLAKVYNYASYLEKSAEIKKYADNYVSAFEKAVQAITLDEEHLTQDAISSLVEKYSKFYSDYVYPEDFGLTLVDTSIQDSYRVIVASFIVKTLMAKFPSVDQSNAYEVRKYLFGYYNSEDLSYHEGCKAYMDAYVAALSAEDSVNSILGYADYLNLLDKLEKLEA